MKALILWLLLLAIDVFKVVIVFIVIFGMASVAGALFIKNWFDTINTEGADVKNFMGSLVIAVISTGFMIAIGLYFFAKPGFEALKTFHFG